MRSIAARAFCGALARSLSRSGFFLYGSPLVARHLRFVAFGFVFRLCSSGGPAGSTPSFYFHDARNLCWSPGRSRSLSHRRFSVRVSFVCVARARGLDAKFFIFTTLVIYVGRPGGWARFRFCAFCFVSRLCASRGPAGSTPSFLFRAARKLCWSPGRPGALSFLCFFFRFSFVCVARARGLDAEFSNSGRS